MGSCASLGAFTTQLHAVMATHKMPTRLEQASREELAHLSTIASLVGVEKMRALQRYRRFKKRLRTQWEEKELKEILDHGGKGYKEFALKRTFSKSLRKIGQTVTQCTVQDFEDFWQQVYGISMGEENFAMKFWEKSWTMQLLIQRVLQL
eukprot:6475447-Amphidinium_carterae.1